MMQLHSDFEACLDKQVAAGVLPCDSAESLLREYLNQTSGLLDAEYAELKEALAVLIRDDRFNSTSGNNRLNFNSIIDDVKNALLFLSSSWENYKEAVTQGILTDDECCDRFSDMLADHGIDYSVFIDFCDIDWVASC